MLLQMKRCFGALLLVATSFVNADIKFETPGVEQLPENHGQWVWVAAGAPSFTQSRLFDSETGNMLGMLSTGYWGGGLVLPSHNREIYAIESHFTRSTRGERTDVVSIYDPKSLALIDEIKIPSKRMTALTAESLSVLTTDNRFLIVQNFTPAQSVSIVDLQERKFVTEIDTPGCNGVYQSGPRGFNLLCGDGSLLWMKLNDQGLLLEQGFSQPFFDPATDPVDVGSVLLDGIEIFASNGGNIYSVDMTEKIPRANKSWPYISKSEMDAGWRYGGFNKMALHEASETLFIIMQQGGDESYEEPATELWVFDLKKKQRIKRLELEHMALGVEVTQGSNGSVLTSAVTFPIPTWAVALLAIFGYEDNLAGIVKFGMDVYDVDSLSFKRAVNNVSNVPTLMQVW